MNPMPYPDEDSEDLTDSEVIQAFQTQGLETVIEVLRAFCDRCPECDKHMSVQEHALRRRKPDLFWRAKLKCLECENLETLTFRVNWMKEDGR